MIRETNVKEADKIVTVLTKDRGVISAYAKGARYMKSQKSAATSLLSYSQFVLFKNRDGYVIDGAQVINRFPKLTSDLERLALAQYFCELSEIFITDEENSSEKLKLILNSLYMLGKNERPLDQVKAVFELRLMTLSGFMPDLVCCSQCLVYEHEKMNFFPDDGVLICGDCCEKQGVHGIETGVSATRAMRFCLYSEAKQLFSFTVSPETLKIFSQASETYIVRRSERRMKALEFYKQLKEPLI